MIDNRDGLGSVPDNDNVDYKGIRVKMRPSVFLELAEYATRNQLPNVDKLKNLIKDGASIGAPFLVIQIPIFWESENYSDPAVIVGHEGRNRMHAIRELEGDNPIEVHLFFAHNLKVQHIKPDWLKQINSRLYPQGVHINYNTGECEYPDIYTILKGPFFSI